MMLKKSMPVSGSAPATDALEKLAEAVRPAEAEETETEAGPVTKRDALRTTVEEDPVAAAAVLSKWLQQA